MINIYVYYMPDDRISSKLLSSARRVSGERVFSHRVRYYKTKCRTSERAYGVQEERASVFAKPKATGQ